MNFLKTQEVLSEKCLCENIKKKRITNQLVIKQVGPQPNYPRTISQREPR